MPLSVEEFVNRWKINALSERSGSQPHFIDLCNMLGQPHPAAADAVGERYTFEKPVSKVYGGKGFADVWLRDHFAWEYKGKHKDLKAAYKQLNDYREDLFSPPLLVVCDFEHFEIHTNFGKEKPRVYAFSLDDLKLNQVTATCPLPPLEVLRALFGDTDRLRPDRTDAFVTQEAAKLFAKLAERLEIEKRAHTDSPQATKEQIAHFLIRLLFCLFADSVDLLPDRVFRRLVEIDRFYPRRFLLKLPNLFAAMSLPDGIFGEHTIRYFNGGLFRPEDISVIQLDKRDMGILYDVAHNYDWSHVAPAIFGTLFERSLNEARRSLIGAHYTSEEDILLLIEPVVMRPLQQRWAHVRDSILVSLGLPTAPSSEVVLPSEVVILAQPPEVVILAQPESPYLSSPSPVLPQSSGAPSLPASSARVGSTEARPSAKRTSRSLLTSNPEAERLLAAWFDELAAVRILDPACGSGNFLYVALRRLLDLWKEARDFAIEHNIQLAMQYAVEKMVSPGQLFGIETEFYAHELASIVVWIGFLQWKHEHGISEDREPILQKLSNIEHADAILRYNADNKSPEHPDGKPYEPTWPPADFIIGNPPFLGDKKMRRELDVESHLTYTDDLRTLYIDRVPGGADLVTFWFEKARAQIEAGNASRAGLLATNSISMVGNRPVLERIKQTGDIFMAWADRPWLLNGAAVRVAMLGFDDGTEHHRILDGEMVETIHADLTSHSNVADAARLKENAELCFLGIMKAGPFDVTSDEARKMLSRPINPNGRPNSDVVKRRMGGIDVSGRPRDGWIIDFGVNMTEKDASLYEWPFEYVKEHVKPLRDKNNRLRTKMRWWIHGEARPGLRTAISNLTRCIVTPEVNKHRVFAWMDTTVIPDHKLHVIARDDDYFFGVLQSGLHEAWTIATCSWIGKGNDPSYNSATTFDTFPFPWPPGTEPSESKSPLVKSIADAARELVRLRDNWLNPKPAPGEPPISEADLRSYTLTKLYNLRTAGKCAWLENAHRALDEAVFAAYGWPSALTTQQILANLLALNHQRAAPANPTH